MTQSYNNFLQVFFCGFTPKKQFFSLFSKKNKKVLD